MIYDVRFTFGDAKAFVKTFAQAYDDVGAEFIDAPYAVRRAVRAGLLAQTAGKDGLKTYKLTEEGKKLAGVRT